MALFFSSARSVFARVVRQGGAVRLLAAFKMSSPPAVWSFDLDKHPHVTLQLKETDGEWDLGLVQPPSGFVAVAHFDERHDAESAYEAVRAALVCDAGRSSRGGLRILGFAMLALFVILLFAPAKTGVEKTAKEKAVSEQSASDAAQGKKIVPGVPMRADDVMVPPAD